MVLLTPNDGNVIAALVQFTGMPEERKKELLGKLEEDDARLVAEVLLGIRKDSTVSPAVQATVDHYRRWMENSRQRRLQREARQRSNRYR
jgi:hypothetical protein